MANTLIDDPAYQAAIFWVIDFETTTPTGAAPEPIEVAVLELRPDRDTLVEQTRHQALMRPPPHAPVTAFDVDQTGITPADVAGRPPADVVLAELDAKTPSGHVVLVAHHAPVEAGVIYAYHQACPRLAYLRILDTVTMAKQALPGLDSYSLDNLIHTLGIPRPTQRHRAMADIEVTTTLFRYLLRRGAADTWRSLTALLAGAARSPKASAPAQQALF